MLTEEKRIKTKGAAEILVKRRIGVLKDLIEDLQLGLNDHSRPIGTEQGRRVDPSEEEFGYLLEKKGRRMASALEP